MFEDFHKNAAFDKNQYKYTAPPLEKNYQVGYNVDKDRASLTKVKNLHETDEIISYRPENHCFRFEILRPEPWYSQKRDLNQSLNQA